jgi:thiamine biosynthesis lipoprotein
MTAEVEALGLTQITFPAMGTSVTVLTTPPHAERAEVIARMAFAAWDAELSRLRPESELSRLNRRETFHASELLLTVAERAMAWARETHGLFDPTLLPQLKALGLDGSGDDTAEGVPRLNVPAAPSPGGGWSKIVIDRPAGQIWLPSGVELDVAGIAKGMAVDATLFQLEAAGCLPALVNAGGDLAARGVPSPPGYWPVGIGDFNRYPPLALKSGAVATSGVSRRQWRRGGSFQHRVIDPATGLPADSGLLAVTVVAGSTEEAEVIAKAAFILGPDSGRGLIESRGLAGQIETATGRVLRAGPWPAPDAGPRSGRP